MADTITALLAAALWAVAVNLVAMLVPWGKVHFALGMVLLLAFPYVQWLLAGAFGGWAVFAACLVLVSLYRLPLTYYLRKLWGQHEPD